MQVDVPEVECLSVIDVRENSLPLVHALDESFGCLGLPPFFTHHRMPRFAMFLISLSQSSTRHSRSLTYFFEEFPLRGCFKYLKQSINSILHVTCDIQDSENRECKVTWRENTHLVFGIRLRPPAHPRSRLNEPASRCLLSQLSWNSSHLGDAGQ